MRRELPARPVPVKEEVYEDADRYSVAKRPKTRMKDLELGFAVCTVGGALLWLAYMCIAASRHHYENVEKFRKIIKPGWLPFSTGIDLTDIQWRQYRQHAPFIMPLLLACIGVRQRIAPGGDSGAKRVPFTVVWSLVVAVVMHGTGAIWLILTITLNYFVARLLRESALAPAWAWGFALSLLFASKTWGEQFWETLLEDWLGVLGRVLSTEPTFTGLFGKFLAPLDTAYNGLYKWSRPLNLTILRLISFNIELWNANCRAQAKTGQGQDGDGPQHPMSTGACPAKPAAAMPTHHGARGSRREGTAETSRCPVSGMVATVQASAEGGAGENAAPREVTFDFWVYWSYVLYPPLYVAGPIMCYDDFARQVTRSHEEEVGLELLPASFAAPVLPAPSSQQQLPDALALLGADYLECVLAWCGTVRLELV